jgi:hypothetical protein
MTFVIKHEIDPYQFIIECVSRDNDNLLDCHIPAYDLYFSYKATKLSNEELSKISKRAEAMVKTFFKTHGIHCE